MHFQMESQKPLDASINSLLSSGFRIFATLRIFHAQLLHILIHINLRTALDNSRHVLRTLLSFKESS